MSDVESGSGAVGGKEAVRYYDIELTAVVSGRALVRTETETKEQVMVRMHKQITQTLKGSGFDVVDVQQTVTELKPDKKERVNVTQ